VTLDDLLPTRLRLRSFGGGGPLEPGNPSITTVA